MNLQEFADRQRMQLALVGAVRADSLMEVSMKLFAVRELTARFQPGAELTREGLMGIAEELLVPLPEKRVVELLLATGLLDDVGGDRYRLRDQVSLRDVYTSSRRAPQETVTFDELRELFDGTGSRDASVVDPDSCVLAMQRTRAWAAEIIEYCVKEGLVAVPVFWPCEDGRHRPLNRLGGSATTMDTLLLLSLSAAYHLAMPVNDRLPQSTLESFLDGIVRLQNRDGGWNDGAFIIPGDDQDFVNAYDPELDQERGACPTVDAAADALLALSLTRIWLRRAAFQEPLDSRLADACRRTMDFILRQQLLGGGWPVYRYEDDDDALPAREVSSALVAEAIAAALEADVVPTEAEARVGDALDALAAFSLRSAGVTDTGDAAWASDFGPLRAGEALLVPTFWVGRLLLHLAAARARLGLPELPELRIKLADAATVVAREWEPDADAFARISFRVATWRGPTATDFHWELPQDALVGSFLLQHAVATDARLSDDLWEKVTRAIAHALDRELHGHWVDFEMKQLDHEDRALPGNTRYYNELLAGYLAYLRSRLPAAEYAADGAHA